MGAIEFEHVGVVVRDLAAAAQFFVDLGFRRGEPAEIAGAWMDRIVGLEGVRVRLVMVSAPDGSGTLELTQFLQPSGVPGEAEPPANAHGYRHVAYRVADIEAIVARARAAGYDTVGDIVDYEDAYRIAYIRGPEGLILEVAQPLFSPR